MISFLLTTHLTTDAGLMIIAFVAAVADTLAGGGGLLTVPALLATGLTPASALATNKLQACFGSTTAAVHFVRHNKLPFKCYRLGVVTSCLGSLAGAFLLTQCNPAFLQKIIPLLLLVILLYIIVSPRFGQEQKPAKIQRSTLWLMGGLALGLYDGFLGPGTGSFWAIAVVFFLGSDLLQATMYAKIFNATSNIAALLLLLHLGHVNITLGIFMAIGQIFGARVGAKLAIKNGANFIRPVFFTMVVIMLIVLVIKFYT